MRCPVCKLNHPTGTKECSCGHDFEAGVTKTDKKTLVHHYKSAYIILYALGGFTLLVAVLIFSVPSFSAFGNGYFTAAIAAIFIASGVLVQTESPITFAAAIVCLAIYSLDTLIFGITLIVSMHVNGSAILSRIFILAALIKSVDTAKELRKMQKAKAASAAAM